MKRSSSRKHFAHRIFTVIRIAIAVLYTPTALADDIISVDAITPPISSSDRLTAITEAETDLPESTLRKIIEKIKVELNFQKQTLELLNQKLIETSKWQVITQQLPRLPFFDAIQYVDVNAFTIIRNYRNQFTPVLNAISIQQNPETNRNIVQRTYAETAEATVNRHHFVAQSKFHLISIEDTDLQIKADSVLQSAIHAESDRGIHHYDAGIILENRSSSDDSNLFLKIHSNSRTLNDFEIDSIKRSIQFYRIRTGASL